MGHPWFAEARGGLMQHIGPGGTKQSDIVARMGLSKQAVQQLIKELEADGILRRDPDPEDGRGKIVRFTDAGLQAKRDSTKAKTRVADQLFEQLGPGKFDMLNSLLKEIGSDQIRKHDRD